MTLKLVEFEWWLPWEAIGISSRQNNTGGWWPEAHLATSVEMTTVDNFQAEGGNGRVGFRCPISGHYRNYVHVRNVRVSDSRWSSPGSECTSSCVDNYCPAHGIAASAKGGER